MHGTLMPARTLVAVSVSGLLLAGCGSTTPAEADAANLRDQLPQSIRSSKVLRIGSYLNYAPVDFTGPDSAPAGLDPDIATALGTYLGLRVQFVDMPFDKLIPAVQSKQVDLAMSAIIDTRLRQDGADDHGRQINPGVDFVDYFLTGTSILVKSGNPLGIDSLDSLCGHTIAVQRGTIQAEFAQRQTGACDNVSKSLQIHLLDDDEQALAEVTAGSAAADLNDYPVAAYNTGSSRGAGRFQLIGGHHQSSPYGITVGKDDAALRQVLYKALEQVIRSGDYAKILTKWNVRSGAVANAVVNGGL
jgi:polar amino acid transport system substrate-binding protein